jgi:hypothetical protein
MSLIALLLLLIVASSCRTTPKAAPIDLSGPDWHTQQGQALWRSKKDAAEIAGEVVLGTNSTGRAFVQFLKNPLPLVTAENSPDRWSIEFIPEQQSFSGGGTPPVQLTWLHLLRAFQEIKPPKRFAFAKNDSGEIQIEDNVSGERIRLFLH